MSWQDTTPNEEAEFGTTYRTSVPMHAWAFGVASPSRIQAALKVGTILGGGRVKVTRLEYFAPGGVPTEWVERGYKKSDWGVRVTWQKVSKGTPVLVLVAVLAAVIAAGVAAVMIVGKYTEKSTADLIHTAGQEARDSLAALFNPGTVIAAIAIVALIMRRK